MIGTYRIEKFNQEYAPLAWGFQVNPSSCGNHEHYEQYIRLIALDDQNRGKGTTHVFLHNYAGKDALLGYITLRATSYTTNIDGVFYGNPAMEIFELAVSKDAERCGIGTTLLKFAVATAAQLRKSSIGIQYLTLCSDAKAVPFYQKFGFGRIDEQGDIPREQWNVNCVPMLLKLPEG